MPKLATLAAKRKSVEACANDRPASDNGISISELLSVSGCLYCSLIVNSSWFCGNGRLACCSSRAVVSGDLRSCEAAGAGDPRRALSAGDFTFD